MAYNFRVHDLSVGYGGVPLIQGINFEVAPGEIMALIGPNGAGKSTILKTITRQLRPLAGTIYIGGRKLSNLSQRELAKCMAVVLTERAKPELMTCRDVVAAGRYPYTGRLGLLDAEDRAKVDAAMEAVRVSELSDRDFEAISDGQRQRVLLARALCQEPEVLVLDEPTSYLDVRHKLELLGLLRSLARERGLSVILSLHEIELAQKLADRVLCVKGETIFASGAPEEIFREDVIRELYELPPGAYDPRSGGVELPRVGGGPQTLVLSNCGAGIPVYRRLQREGVPFVAGVLCRNDLDYPLARALAAEVIESEPFCPLEDAAVERAKEWALCCARVIDAGVTIGPENARVSEVLGLAEALGKLEKC